MTSPLIHCAWRASRAAPGLPLLALALALFAPGCPSCSEDPLGPDEIQCRVGSGGGTCTLAECVLVVPPRSLPGGTDVTLALEPPENPLLAAELLGGRECVVGPPGLVFDGAADLRMAYDPAALPAPYVPEEIIGVEEPAGSGVLALKTPFLGDPASSEVAVSVGGAGRFGLSLSPDGPSASVLVGGERLAVSDEATFLRNVSSFPIWEAFWDGAHLFVGNGPRLLVYTGIPDSPAQEPDFILGRPNLEDTGSTPTASNFSGAVSGIWSDGTRLAVSTGNRVLVWLSMPEETYAPADIVLGQPSFGVDAPNSGGISATSMSAPDDLTSDGTRLIVADALNHRWLVWNEFPLLSGTPADVVIGQASFTTGADSTGAIPANQARGALIDGDDVLLTTLFGGNVVYGLDAFPASSNPAADFLLGVQSFPIVTATSFRYPTGLSRVGAGGLGVRDLGCRIGIYSDFAAAAAAPGTPFDITVGRPHPFTGGTAIGDVSASSFTTTDPRVGFYADDSILLAPDGTRLLVWTSLPEWNFAPADRVLFTGSPVTADVGVDYRRVSARSLGRPVHAAWDGATFAVADSANSRVLLYDGAAPPATDAAAAVVVGQPDELSFHPNRGGAPSATTLAAPEGVDLAGGRLAVADTHNHRVLLWNTVPAAADVPADVVLGAPDFATVAPNAGRGDADGDGYVDAGPDGLFYPSDVALSPTALYVADRFNHRVLVWSPIPAVSGTPATDVIGQPDLVANAPNRGGGFYSPLPNGFNEPSGVSWDASAGRLLVADEENNRVLLFTPGGGGGAALSADLVVGQPDGFTVSNPNFHLGFLEGIPMDPPVAPTPSALVRPFDALVWNGGLFVADTGNNRVAVWLTAPVANGASADLFLGQPDGTTSTRNSGGVGAAGLAAPAGLAASGAALAVVDRANHRVVVHDSALSPLLPFRPADGVLGQSGLGSNAFNGGDGILTPLARPLGASWDGTRLYVADADHHRIAVYDGLPASDDVPPDDVVGQDTGYGASANGGGAPGRGTLHSPSDVYSDGTYVIVADTGNHRVLVWLAETIGVGSGAVLVLGQPDYGSVAPNAGAGVTAPTAAGLFSPRAVYLDPDGRLFVADSGNNRVLVWDQLPEVDGAPADHVLGQPDFTSNLVNGGAPGASAGTLAGPEDVLVVAGRLFVADSLNNRVLAWPADFADSSPATLVLGQPDFTSRSALGAGGLVGPATLSFPSGLTTDDRYLFVSDLGDNRVLVFELEALADGGPAWTVIGQPDFATAAPLPTREGLSGPARTDALRLPFNETVLLVPSSGANRVVLYDGITRVADLIPRP